MSVATNIFRLRAAAGETIEEVAAGTRITENIVRGIEMGRTTQDWQIAALAAYFGISIDELTAS